MSSPFNLTDTKALIKAQPLIVDAYNKLGADRVKSLRYIKKDIEAALINADSESSNITKAAKMLYNKLGVGFYATPAIKEAIASTYSELGIMDKPKTSEIEKYFDCQATNKKIDGKTTRGYELYRHKIIFR